MRRIGSHQTIESKQDLGFIGDTAIWPIHQKTLERRSSPAFGPGQITAHLRQSNVGSTLVDSVTMIGPLLELVKPDTPDANRLEDLRVGAQSIIESHRYLSGVDGRIRSRKGHRSEYLLNRRHGGVCV